MRRVFTDGGGDRVLAIDPRAVGQEYEQGSAPAGNESLKSIAVVCIEGPLEQRAGWFGDGYDRIRSRFEKALETADAVVLRINSPGGDAAGNLECARAMIAAKEASGKLVLAYADEAAYSAAYALACVADEIYLPDTGGVGSVGCLCVAADMVKAVKGAGINAVVIRSGTLKADGHPLLPLTDETIERFQERVDGLADLFAGLVSDSRGTSKKAILALEGACFYGQDAIAKDLADGVMSFDEVVAGLSLRLEKETTPLDGVAQPVPASKYDGGKSGDPMSLTALYAKLSAAKAANNAAEIASLEAQIQSAKATKAAKKKAEEEERAEDEESEEEERAASAEDDGDGDDDDDDDGDKKPMKKKGYKKSKSSASADALSARLVALQAKENAALTRRLEAQVAALEAKQSQDEVNDLVDAGMKAGKITPAESAHMRTASAEWLRKHLAVAPVRGTSEGLQPGTEMPGPNGLTALDLEICTRMNCDPKKYAESKAKGLATNFSCTRSA